MRMNAPPLMRLRQVGDTATVSTARLLIVQADLSHSAGIRCSAIRQLARKLLAMGESAHLVTLEVGSLESLLVSQDGRQVLRVLNHRTGDGVRACGISGGNSRGQSWRAVKLQACGRISAGPSRLCSDESGFVCFLGDAAA